MLLARMEVHKADLPQVRRLEAVGFRAWPASFVVYDGSWQVRLTAGHASKRLNCVVPLDPSDHRDAGQRLHRIAKHFEAYGRPLLVRETPLCPPALVDELKSSGWSSFEATDVMTVDLAELELPDTLDHLPSHDITRFVDASLVLGDEKVEQKAALAEILSSIKPASGYFIKESQTEGLIGAGLCVQDNDLAGILAFAVAEEQRRKGAATEILTSALRWARISGARTAWLQVMADNAPAIALYRKFGFAKVYEYHYWRKG